MSKNDDIFKNKYYWYSQHHGWLLEISCWMSKWYCVNLFTWIAISGKSIEQTNFSASQRKVGFSSMGWSHYFWCETDDMNLLLHDGFLVPHTGYYSSCWHIYLNTILGQFQYAVLKKCSFQSTLYQTLLCVWCMLMMPSWGIYLYFTNWFCCTFYCFFPKV